MVGARSVDDDVLSVLRRCEFEGNLLFLPAIHLDRTVYQKVDKVLQSCGGKWNRKSKAHLFEGEARDAVESVIETGQWVDAKQALGFFETPVELAEEVARKAEISAIHSVLEPSAGRGRLVQAASKYTASHNINAFEIDRQHFEVLDSLGCYVYIRDFLKVEPAEQFERVVMNPPFARQADIDHVLHAWRFIKPRGRLVAIMSSGWSFRENSKSLLFRDFVQENGSVEPNEVGAFKESGTLVNTVTVVLDKP